MLTLAIVAVVVLTAAALWLLLAPPAPECRDPGVPGDADAAVGDTAPLTTDTPDGRVAAPDRKNDQSSSH